jgi:hypothetical protein
VNEMGGSLLGGGDSGFANELRVGDGGGEEGHSNDMRIEETEPDRTLKVGEAALRVEATLATNVSGGAGVTGESAGSGFPRLERDDVREGGNRFTASIAFIAMAVVRPRFPILIPDEPYL